jgi:AcrR family transcriptional regulator
VTAGAPSTRGRPRDPELQERVFDAVIEVYADAGWAGFSLEAVARRARVGREALYRRWTDKAQLLAQAVTARAPQLEPVDTGSTVGDLTALARHFLDSYRGPSGVVGLRMVLDARTNPELAEQFAALLDSDRAGEARRIVQRAVSRGDVAADVPATVVLQTIAGATLTHVLYATSPPSTRADNRLVQQLVALLVRAD